MSPLIRVVICLLLLFPGGVSAYGGDTLKTEAGEQADYLSRRANKPPKHYIKSCIYFSRYGTSPRDMNGTVPTLNKRLGFYNFTHYNLGFYAPLVTKAWYRKDSVSLANFHLLFTVNANSSLPHFSGQTEQHRLYKFGLGLRAIYNSGKKSIWFFDASPHSVGDKLDKTGTRLPLYSSILVWDYVHSADFSFRLGFTRTFLFGNRLHLPMVGMRFGRLDKRYLSIQFPRSVTAAWVASKNVTLSVYTKPFGGLYRFSNKDSIYIDPDVKVITFGRWELTNGARIDLNAGSNFSMFFAGGISMNSRLTFASPDFDQNSSVFGIIKPFYRASMKPSPFLHVGLSLRFGKTKKLAGDHRLYEVIDMNNMYDAGDNNDGPGNGQIPATAKQRELERMKYHDVSDLFDVGDLY
ncbi:MAG: hypothetical protein FD123_3207 [Bacteroidetes bacterium]|nr:MAG: hypothetical protein FD123_3207 [Bacteroidota bacterium]